ncbi:MAG: hypothetical protein MZW92_03135 [Comamonadaceae bacterium]|nr:hypothetical protein [Comamonadaceae bacterium]
MIALAAPAAAAGADLTARRCAGAVVDLGLVTVGETGFGHGLRFGGGFFFRTGKHAAIEVLVGRSEVPVAEGAAGTDIDPRPDGREDGDDDAPRRPPLVSVQPRSMASLRPLRRRLLVHRLQAGRAPPRETVRAVERDLVDRMALQLGGGLDCRLTPRLAACFKARYNLVKTWVEDLPRTAPIRDTDPLVQNMLSLYGLELSLGIKFAF